jgi:hypothetical protein
MSSGYGPWLTTLLLALWNVDADADGASFERWGSHCAAPSFPCTIRRAAPASDLSWSEFRDTLYASEEPVLFAAAPGWQKDWSRFTSDASLMDLVGGLQTLRAAQGGFYFAAQPTDEPVVLRTPHTLIVAGGTVRDFVVEPDASAAESTLQIMLNESVGVATPSAFLAPCHDREAPPVHLTVARAGAGSPLHAHGRIWNLLLRGTKKWWFAPPGYAAGDSRSASAREWALGGERAALERASGARQCTQHRGEVVYVPSRWKHATLALCGSVGVARAFCIDGR